MTVLLHRNHHHHLYHRLVIIHCLMAVEILHGMAAGKNGKQAVGTPDENLREARRWQVEGAE